MNRAAEITARVVHVDDNRADAVTVRRLIADVAPDAEVISLDSSDALFELLHDTGEAARTNLILLDLRMPRMSGHETIAWLKSRPELGHIPVVALTSSRNPADMDAAYEQGANAYLVKSSDLDQYRNKLTAALLMWCSTDVRDLASNGPLPTTSANTPRRETDTRLRALVVEDAPADANLLQRQLEELRHWSVACDVASNLAQAQARLEQQSYDLLFLDHRLPDGDGIELLDRLHYLFGDAGTILLTGYGDERVAADAIRAGIDAYIPKREMDAEALEGSMGRALERSRQRSGQHCDPLTGLNNRAAFQARLIEERNRCRRYGGRFALMLIDLDSFKAVNDSLGHVVGDDLLRQCAAALRRLVRGEDFLARYGGDEFCVIAPGTSAACAERLAGRLRENLSATLFHCGREQHPVSIGCSVGIVEVDGSIEAEPEEYVRRVDEAMYRAKEPGEGGVRVLAPHAPD